MYDCQFGVGGVCVLVVVFVGAGGQVVICIWRHLLTCAACVQSRVC